ncbi:GLUG motif-containing protein, partial [Vreelandella neptunia]|uniref:GLUG motif-containing protein n=1 Tax=Vreelandella neptunia TaxID=115551 RepID=UPI00315AA50A
GEDASAIYGNLNANGQVFLINPNGVLFGQGAAVNVGALVASTLSLSDEDFNNGHYQFSGDGNNAAVVNHGTLNADGGAVALLGGQVSNHGIIQANQGTVALAAGDQITLDFAGDGLLNVTVDEGTLNALVENHQLVRANGGQVIMTANATDALLQTVVNNTGVIEAQTLDNQSGTIVLRGGFNGGTVNVAGTLDASAPDSGDGGFIDTSGAHVKIAGGTQVTTKANSGTTGEWLIDPTDFTISAGSAAQTASGIGAATLSANLENNNVTLETVDTGSEAGDMYVNGAVSWDANTTLSLDAHNDIHINQAITATGTNAGLVLNTGAGKDYAIASDAAITLSGSNAALNINGTDYTLIHDMAALDAIDTTGLGGAYALAINLDASGTTYDHALVGVDDTNAFTGTFAGLGHTISNLTINKTVEAKEYIGLFGVNNGLIRDIGLEGGSVSVFGNGDKYGGALAGYNDTSGIIVNVTATGNVNVNAYGSISYGGGLVGHNQGTITHATASGEVRTDGSGRGYSGGLVAINKGTITHATASGTVVNQNSSIRGRYAGGLVAVNDAGTITHATATGNVSSASGAEGYMGGLVGLNNSGNITYTHATGNVSVISSNNGYAGGLVGANNSGTITHSYATGNVSASVTGSTPYAGGLVGHNTGTVTYTYATGNVSGSSTGNLWFGGLVGHNQGDISYAYASGDTTTNGSGSGSYTLFLGGLVGLNQSSGTIDNAYATGTAKATNSAGTLAIGGFSGRSDGTITASYWDTETSGLSAGGAASGTTGLTTEQMLQADSFTGWDIDAQGGTGTVWRIYEGHTAPLLRNFLTALEVTGDSTTTYNGTEQSGTWSATGEYDANHIFGQASGGGRNAGTYNIDMSGLYSDQQGYDLITTNGTLTINKAQATVTANSGTTTYNGTEQSV